MRSPFSQLNPLFMLAVAKLRMLPLLLVAIGLGFSTRSVAASASMAPLSLEDVNSTIAQDFSPPDEQGGASQRQGGSTRGGLVIQGTPVVALIPSSNLGTTLSPNPTFFFYIPIEVAGLDAELVLADDQGKVVYRAIATLPDQHGIVSMALPASINLEPGRDYQWFFSVLVSPEDRASDIVLSGWVQRRMAEATLTQQIAATSPVERPALYAQAGIWYDALSDLAELRQADPADAALQNQWWALLESVELGAIATQPLLDRLAPYSETLLPADGSTATEVAPVTPVPNTYAIPDLPATPSPEVPLALPEVRPLLTEPIQRATPASRSPGGAPGGYVPPDARGLPGRREGGGTR